jgi:hypothetical protein
MTRVVDLLSFQNIRIKNFRFTDVHAVVGLQIAKSEANRCRSLDAS